MKKHAIIIGLMIALLTTVPHPLWAAQPTVQPVTTDLSRLDPESQMMLGSLTLQDWQGLQKQLEKWQQAPKDSQKQRQEMNVLLKMVVRMFRSALNGVTFTAKEIGKSLVSPSFWISVLQILPLLIILVLLVIFRKPIGAVANEIKDFIQWLISKYLWAKKQKEEAEKAYRKGKEKVIRVAKEAKDIAVDAAQLALQAAQDAARRAQEALQAAQDALQSAKEGAVQKAQDALQAAQDAFNSAQAALSAIGEIASQAAQDAVNKAQETLKAVENTLGSAKNFLTQAVENIIELAKKVAEALQAIPFDDLAPEQQEELIHSWKVQLQTGFAKGLQADNIAKKLEDAGYEVTRREMRWPAVGQFRAETQVRYIIKGPVSRAAREKRRQERRKQKREERREKYRRKRERSISQFPPGIKRSPLIEQMERVSTPEVEKFYKGKVDLEEIFIQQADKAGIPDKASENALEEMERVIPPVRPFGADTPEEALDRLKEWLDNKLSELEKEYEKEEAFLVTEPKEQYPKKLPPSVLPMRGGLFEATTQELFGPGQVTESLEEYEEPVGGLD